MAETGLGAESRATILEQGQEERVVAYTKRQIVGDLAAYVRFHGGNFSGWYVGISANPRTRLFDDHRVRARSDKWIFRAARDAVSARAVEGCCIRTMSTQGGAGGGDCDSRFVYAYKIGMHTRE